MGERKYEDMRDLEEYKKQSLLRLADAQEIREPPGGSHVPESVLEKTLRRGSSGSASYLVTPCRVLPCEGEAPDILSNLKHCRWPPDTQERVRKSLTGLRLKQQLTQRPTAWASGLGREPCTRALGAGPAEARRCGVSTACREWGIGGWLLTISFMHCMAHSTTATKWPNQEWTHCMNGCLCPAAPPTYTSCRKEQSLLYTWYKAWEGVGRVV